MPVTTQTADRLARLADAATVISEELFRDGYRSAADAAIQAAGQMAQAARALREGIERYERLAADDGEAGR